MSVRSKKSNTSGSGTGSSGSSSLSKILSFSRSLEKGSFGVLYTMIKNNTFPKALTIISFVIEFLQLCSFGFKKSFPWGGDAGAGLKKVVSPFSHPANLLEYDAFSWLYYAAVLLMGLGFLNILYIAYNFYQNKIANIWGIRTLRWFVSFSVSVLYIPILSLFLIPLNCETVDGINQVSRFNDIVECYGKRNVPKVIISILIIVFFSIIAFASQATYYEYDSQCKDRFAKPNARFDLTILIVKTILSFFFELLSDQPWVLCVTYFLGMIWLCIGSIMFMPYNFQRLNQVKSGLYFVALWVSLLTLFTQGVDNIESPATAYVVIIGLPFVFTAGYFSNLYFKRWLGRKFNKFQISNLRTESMNDIESQKEQTTSGKVTFSAQTRTLGSMRQINFPFFDKKFCFPFFVEIMTRTALKNTQQDGHPDSASIERVNLFYQCALQYYPKSHLLWMAYCNFLFTVRKDRQIGYAALEKLRRISPSFDVRFYIYQRDKEREQIMDSDLRGPDQHGKIQDFVSYMEFKKLYNGAKRYHLKCLTYIQRFWKLLLHETIDLHRLSDLSGRIASSENKATEHYERLLALNPNSVRVLRDFSQFLEDVVKDKDSALRLQKKAETIEDIMSKSQTHEHIKFIEVQNIDDKDIPIGENNAVALEKIEKGSQHSKSKESVSESSISSRGRQKRYQEFQQSNSITKLSWFMIISTFLSILFCISILVALRSLCIVHVNTYQGILSLGDGAIETVSIANRFNQIHILKDSGNTSLFDAYQAEAKLSITRLKNIHNAIYYGETAPQSFVNYNKYLLKKEAGLKVFDISKEVIPYQQFNKTNPVTSPLLLSIYDEPSVDIFIFVTPDNPAVTNNHTFMSQKYNAWKAINIFIESAFIVNGYTIADIAELETDPNYKFVIKNQENIAMTFEKIQNAYSLAVMAQSTKTANIILYIWLGSFGLLFLLAVFLFRPVVSKITREKMRTLILFSLAPRDIVIKMATKKIKMVSLDSGSDRDVIFDTDEGENDEDEDKKNVDVLGDDQSIKTPSEYNNNNLTKIKSSPSRSVFGQSGDSLFSDQRRNSGGHLYSDKKYLMESTQPQTSPLVTSYVLEDDDGADTNHKLTNSQTKEPKEKEIKFGWDGKSKRNLNKKSLRSILRRLHLSYVFALFLLFGFMTMGLFVSFAQVFKDTGSGSDIVLSSQRAVLARLSNYLITELAINDTLAYIDPQAKIISTITAMQTAHQSLHYIEEIRSLMDGTSGCFFIDNPCPTTTSPYYFDISQGLDWVIHQFTKHSLNLAATTQQITSSDPDYEWILQIGQDPLYDGLDTATYLFFRYWQGVQNGGVKIITSVMSVVIVLLVFIYTLIFRPFINRLRVQHIHTLALLRLTPEDIRNIEVSEKIIDED